MRGRGAANLGRTALLGNNHIGRDCQIGARRLLFPTSSSIRTARSATASASTRTRRHRSGRLQLRLRRRPPSQDAPDRQTSSWATTLRSANTAIDRGALGPTTIGQGCKIDNLVTSPTTWCWATIASSWANGFCRQHQARDYCVIASQSGIAGHLKLGHQATVGAQVRRHARHPRQGACSSTLPRRIERPSAR